MSMTILNFVVILLMFSTAGSGDSEKGTCPPPLKTAIPSTDIPKRVVPSPPVAGVHYAGTVTMLVSLSDTGYVCEVNVVKGIDAALDQQATAAIREEVFQPIRLDGNPISGSMMINRDFWRGDKSDIVIAQNADASSDEIPPEAKTVTAVDPAFLISAARIDGSGYRNGYFGIAFTAKGASLTIPPLSDNHGQAIRLVDAVATAQNRNDRYAISVLAERLSDHPQLKSETEYVQYLSSQLQREGAKKIRGYFPFVISGVQFMGTILQESDGPGASHFVGVFSTARKGYFLSFDIAAATEHRVLGIASSFQVKDDH